MEKFYIKKTAIYLHGIYGPYDSVDQAKGDFLTGYEQGDNFDFDGHHKYSIVEGLPKFDGESNEGGKLVCNLPYEARSGL